MGRPKTLKQLIDEQNALQPGARPAHPRGDLVDVVIIHPGPYSDYEDPSGHVGAKIYTADDVGRFPAHYAKGIVDKGLARLVTLEEIAAAESELETERAESSEPLLISTTRAARKLAAATGIDLATLKGSGTDGRILVVDVQKAVTQGG